MIERARGKHAAALAALGKARAIKPLPGVLSDVVETLLAMSDAVGALTAVNEAIAASPRSLTLRILHVRALAAAARCDEAKAASAALPEKGQAATRDALATCGAPRGKPAKAAAKKR